MSYKVWYVKHGESGKIVPRNQVPKFFEEGLSLSPNHTMLYNINKSSPNPYLAKFGYIVQNIPGDAVVIYEEEGRPKNIHSGFEEQFPEILKHDAAQRDEVVQEWENMGIAVMRF